MHSDALVSHFAKPLSSHISEILDKHATRMAGIHTCKHACTHLYDGVNPHSYNVQSALFVPYNGRKCKRQTAGEHICVRLSACWCSPHVLTIKRGMNALFQTGESSDLHSFAQVQVHHIMPGFPASRGDAPLHSRRTRLASSRRAANGRRRCFTTLRMRKVYRVLAQMFFVCAVICTFVWPGELVRVLRSSNVIRRVQSPFDDI